MKTICVRSSFAEFEQTAHLFRGANKANFVFLFSFSSVFNQGQQWSFLKANVHNIQVSKHLPIRNFDKNKVEFA